MTSRDPQMCCEPHSTFGGHVTSQCEAVRSAILASDSLASCQNTRELIYTDPTFYLLMKMGLLIRNFLGKSQEVSHLSTIFDNIWEVGTHLTDIISFYLLAKDLTTTSRNNFQEDVKK